MKIMYKLMSGFILLVLLFSIAGATVISNLKVIETVNTQVGSDFAINQYATNYERGAGKVQVGTYLYSQGSQAMGKQLIDEGKDAMAQNRDNLKNIMKDEAAIKELGEIERIENLAMEASDGVVSRVNNPDKDASIQEKHLKQDMHFLEARVDALNLKLGTFVDKTQEETSSSLKVAQESGNRTTSVTIYAIVLSLLIALVVSFVVAKKITDPVKQLTNVANKVSKGDMTEKVEVSSSDEIGDLAESFKRMINAFKVMEAMSKEESAPKG
ncbi:MAG: HAMP domain-containing protein [Candidatus Methanoperedens sp.]